MDTELRAAYRRRRRKERKRRRSIIDRVFGLLEKALKGWLGRPDFVAEAPPATD